MIYRAGQIYDTNQNTSYSNNRTYSNNRLEVQTKCSIAEHVTKNSNTPHITPPTRVPDDTLSSITLPLSSLVLTSKWT